MWWVEWWNRIHCLVDPAVAFLDMVILRILIYCLVPILTKKIQTGDTTYLVTIYLIMRLLPIRWWWQIATSTSCNWYHKADTHSKWFELLFFSCTIQYTIELCDIDSSAHNHCTKHYGANLYVPHRTGVCLYNVHGVHQDKIKKGKTCWQPSFFIRKVGMPGNLVIEGCQ